MKVVECKDLGFLIVSNGDVLEPKQLKGF